MISRRQAREIVYKLVYEYLFLGKTNERSVEVFCAVEMSGEEAEYIKSVYFGVAAKRDELMLQIREVTENFELERIYRSDLAALLIAIFEMKYVEKIPNSVSINEAVELVKQYSTEKSYSFVNGVLSAVNKRLAKKGS